MVGTGVLVGAEVGVWVGVEVGGAGVGVFVGVEVGPGVGVSVGTGVLVPAPACLLAPRYWSRSASAWRSESTTSS